MTTARLRAFRTIASVALVVGAASPCIADTDSSSSGGNLLAQAAAAGELDQAASLLDAEERQTRDKYESTQQELRRVSQRLLTRGRVYVRMLQMGMLPLSGGFPQFLDRLSRVERLRRGILSDMERQRTLNQRIVVLSGRLQALREQRGPLGSQQLATLSALNTAAEAQQRALAFERAFAAVPSHTAVYGARVPFGESPGQDLGFSAMKGRLPFPVAGRAEILTAKRQGGGGPGLEMRVALGSSVQAVFSGRVAFADRYADYGRTVIVDHGDAYFSVSAGLQTIRVTVGQDVAAGTTLGTVGDSGSGPALYFELRRAGDPLDPAPWFGI